MTPDPLVDVANPLSPAVPQPITQSKLLIGEGKDDFHVLSELLRHLGISDVQVEEYGGKDNLVNYLETLKVRPGFGKLSCIGITRDADADRSAAFQSLCGSLDRHGLAKPSNPGSFSPPSPRVGVFIFTGDAQMGALEDFCLTSLAGDVVTPCVEQFVDCLDKIGRVPRRMGKARMQAWLAAQRDPGKRLGEAARAGYLDWNNPAFDPLCQFLRAL